MTDELNPDGGSSPLPGEPAPSGADLDRLLSEAADLAAEVTAEVGTLPVRTTFENVPIDSLESDATDIQQKLDDLDQILDRTANEIGAATSTNSSDTEAQTGSPLPVPDFMSEFMDVEQTAPQQPPPPAPPPTAAAPPPAPSITPAASGAESAASETPPAVPDFMSEFTKPESATTSGAGQSNALTPPIASRNPPKLGVVGSPVTPIDVKNEPAMVGVKSVAPAAAKQTAAPAASAAPPVVSTGGPAVTIQSVPADPAKGAAAQVVGESAAPQGKSGGAVMPLATLAVRALEMIDRPFARLGPGPRKVIGVLALLVFAASLVVFTASLL